MFSWKPIYAEITARLLEFESENSTLAKLMVNMHARGLKVSSVIDQNPKGHSIELDETDPFTFMAIFNRSVTNRNRVGTPNSSPANRAGASLPPTLLE